jgi:hypothetical protein
VNVDADGTLSALKTESNPIDEDMGNEIWSSKWWEEPGDGVRGTEPSEETDKLSYANAFIAETPR